MRLTAVYEYRAMIKSGPGFEIMPSKWARFWKAMARFFLGC